MSSADPLACNNRYFINRGANRSIETSLLVLFNRFVVIATLESILLWTLLLLVQCWCATILMEMNYNNEET